MAGPAHGVTGRRVRAARGAATPAVHQDAHAVGRLAVGSAGHVRRGCQASTGHGGSLYHQGDNIDRARFRELVGAEPPAEPAAPRPPLREWLLSWVRSDDHPREELDLLPGVLWHLSDAWARREQPNVVLVHYDDLSADLEGEMRRLAERLSITIPEAVWPKLVHAASFEQMKRNADQLVPDQNGIFKDLGAFFRRGRSGAGRDLLDGAELAAYRKRVAELAPPDLVAWLHRD